MAVYRFIKRPKSGLWVAFDFYNATQGEGTLRFDFGDVSVFELAIFIFTLNALGGTNPSIMTSVYNGPGGYTLGERYKEFASTETVAPVVRKIVITNLMDTVTFETIVAGTTPTATWRGTVYFK